VWPSFKYLRRAMVTKKKRRQFVVEGSKEAMALSHFLGGHTGLSERLLLEELTMNRSRD
jgi:hypothetical protein